MELWPPDTTPPPGIHQENLDVVDAYNRVAGCVHTNPIGGMGPPIWADIKPVLSLHGMWEPQLQETLGNFMAEIRKIAQAEAEENRADDPPAVVGGE